MDVQAINKNERIYIAGHNGMVGSAIMRKLLSQGVLKDNIIVQSRYELDLTNQQDVNKFINKEKPTQVYLAAAKVGGIKANNDYPADFIYQNIIIQSNVIEAAYQNGVKKLLFLGSSCIYPREAQQPIDEEALLTGKLEPTNEPYAIAKIAGIKMCESYNRQHNVDYRSLMPTNLYGPGDNYHPEYSHVIPALLRRFHEAKVGNKESVIIWGTGKPRREFLFVDDLADASIFIMNLSKEKYKSSTKPMLSHINVGSGQEFTISEVAKTISNVVGFKGKIEYDERKPEGAPRKLLNSESLIKLGWAPAVTFEKGISIAYNDFINKV